MTDIEAQRERTAERRNDVMSADSPFLRSVVVGVDGSDGSHRALQWAAKLGQASGARVVAVHVLTYDRELLTDLSPDTMRSWRRDLDHDLRTTWTEPLTAAQVDHDCELLEADSPAEGLLAVADRERADAMVVGTGGRSALAGRVLGSTSYKLTHHALRPVVVVPRDWSPNVHVVT